jgi:predicted DNA-binding transcriptional regulator YafY
MKEIYSNGYVVVYHDPTDELPIGIASAFEEVDEDGSGASWLNAEDVQPFLEAIAKAVATIAPRVVCASEVSLNEGLLRLAAAHEREVEFGYAKGDGAVIERRRLVPYEVKQVGDHLTFVGYDPDRDEPRAYRVDRMKGEAKIT